MSRTILGYADRFSVAPGEKIAFKASCEGHAHYHLEIVRLISGDLSPAGPGFREEVVPSGIAGNYPGRHQEIAAGSYAVVADSPALHGLGQGPGVSVSAMVWPTTPGRGLQILIDRRSKAGGFALALDAAGSLALILEDGAGGHAELSTGRPLLAREWYFLAAAFDPARRRVLLMQEPQKAYARDESQAQRELIAESGIGEAASPLAFAAALDAAGWARGHYNGKIDSPRLYCRALPAGLLRQTISQPAAAAYGTDLVGAWDFSLEMGSDRIRDRSPNRLDGRLVNLPTRAMKGWNWDASELDWRRAPEQYGAIHFHDDDLYDAGWQTDVVFEVPRHLRSGLYAARLQDGDEVERIPFFILPPRGTATADTLFLIPTASYMAYANERLGYDSDLAEVASAHLPAMGREDLFLNAHREYGYSFYEVHSDGSGVSISSRLRPILNMRPGHTSSWIGPAGSGPWQFNADLHISAWLEGMGHRFDVATDEDLHDEGLALLQRYRVVITGTHPEYYSKAMSDAVQAYLDRGGRLMYLGANGFYWRIAFHRELPGVIELRRVEDGVRDWSGEPGEYYMSFTGEYGGLWRRNGRPPQALAGVGFVAQGFDVSSYYVRKPGSFDPRAAFIFEGIGPEERIGDFGLVGGGAAGLELDIVDRALGSPPHTLVLAASEGHGQAYILVPEEVTSTFPNVDGPQNPKVRGDLAFFETPNGGGVFSTGSIAWAGSLWHKGSDNRGGWDNNVSRITDNVLRRFKDPTPL
ncbi:MAG TPA: N,N-dimethylformamidase beta subunit family domain-containing protein [Dongiaceae bacterium]|nr:N,N-dimethylformamidase beta subunit family domain-containing protein [Dongiaceae bacterium]